MKSSKFNGIGSMQILLGCVLLATNWNLCSRALVCFHPYICVHYFNNFFKPVLPISTPEVLKHFGGNHTDTQIISLQYLFLFFISMRPLTFSCAHMCVLSFPSFFPFSLLMEKKFSPMWEEINFSRKVSSFSTGLFWEPFSNCPPGTIPRVRNSRIRYSSKGFLLYAGRGGKEEGKMELGWSREGRE